VESEPLTDMATGTPRPLPAGAMHVTSDEETLTMPVVVNAPIWTKSISDTELPKLDPIKLRMPPPDVGRPSYAMT